MEIKPEEKEPHKNPEGEVPPLNKVEIDKEKLSDLEHKASVSSQNFERAKKAEAELAEVQARLAEIEGEDPSEVSSREVKALQKQIEDLGEEVSGFKSENAKKDVFIQYPMFKEKEVWEEFEKFRELPDNKGMNMKTAAKAFAVENGMLDPKRDGLEKPSSGERKPAPARMSHEDIAKLRETNFPLYKKKLLSGELQP